MSLIKNIEIDTLKLRALQVRDSKNNPISSGFQLFAVGDGTTYWSSGITASQYSKLSTSLNDNNSTIIGIESSITSTLTNVESSLTNQVYSSINSISSFLALVQNYEINNIYADAVVSRYSTNIGVTLVTQYQTVSSASTFYGLGLENTANSISIVNQELSNLNILIQSTNQMIEINSTITTSTIFANLSSYTTSTFDGVFVIESTNFGVLNRLILTNIAFTQNSLNNVSTNQGVSLSTFKSVPDVLNSTVNAISTQTSQTISSNNRSTLLYINQQESTLWSSTLTLTGSIYSSTQTNLLSAVSTLNGLRGNSVSSVLSAVYQISTQNGLAFNSFNNNIVILLSTGLTQNIYQTFIDLQAYSENLILSTTSTSNYVINSTNTALIEQNVSSFNGLMDSSFSYVNNNLYYSSLSTLIPELQSTINTEIISSNNYFNFVIASTTQYFTLLVNATYVAFSQDVTTITQNAEAEISTQIGIGLATQNNILKENVSSIDGLINQLLTTNVNSLSSFTYNQYLTAPSIIMNKVNNLSTLSNTVLTTGLSTLITSIGLLDATTYNNFYVLISDIGSNIYYGLAISTNKAKINQEFTVQIDIQSTYTNNFYILDTTNLSFWLSTPTIYNPKSYSLTTNELSTLPPPDTQSQIYISSFIGSYILTMKYTSMGMFIKNIQTYPFIYSNATFTGTLNFPQNVQVSDTTLSQFSSFVYRGSPLLISWQTNDLNMPLGVKFIGIDLYGRQMTSWVGPFSSALGSVTIKIPTPSAPLGRYDSINLGIYPNNPRANNTSESNSAMPIFSTRIIPGSIHVVNPTINSYTRVLNPGSVNTYLQVTDIAINNDLGQDMTKISTNAVFTIDTDTINLNTVPYNGSYINFGWQNAFDGNLSTFFFGGYTVSQINQSAYVGAHFSTIISFENINQKAAQVSSIDIYQGPLYSLEGMQLIFSNRNEPGLPDGLFYSTITLISSFKQSYSFS